MNPFIKRALIGGGIGAAGRSAYNITEGRGVEEGVMKSALIGAGIGMGSHAIKPSTIKAGFNAAKPLMYDAKVNATSYWKSAKNWGKTSGRDGLNKVRGMGNDLFGGAKAAPKFNSGFRGAMRSSNANGGILNASMVRSVGYGMRGAGIGAGVGATYGAFSDKESMISGAMKGALLGTAVGGATGAFRLNKKFNMNTIKNTWNKHVR